MKLFSYLTVIFSIATALANDADLGNARQSLTMDRAEANAFLPNVRNARARDDPEELSEAQAEVTEEGREGTRFVAFDKAQLRGKANLKPVRKNGK